MKKLNLLLISIASLFTGCTSKAASVGMIGGADGPTAIFVTSKINWIDIVLIIIAVVLLIIYIIKRKK